jgi:hypothetical protein
LSGKDKPPKFLFRGFRLPEAARNDWPEALREMDAVLRIEPAERYPTLPPGFTPLWAIVERADAEVDVQSLWNAERGYLLTLHFEHLQRDLALAKEIEALFLTRGWQGETEPLSELERFLS